MKITLHSQVGIITNSSTELFVLKQPLDNLKELLEGLVTLHNLVYQTPLNERPIEHNEVLSKITPTLKSNEKIKSSVIGLVDDFNTDEYYSESPLTYDSTFGDIKVYTQEDYKLDTQSLQEDFDRWADKGHSFYTSPKELGWGYEMEESIGKTFLYGAYDNSIPYWMFDVIYELGVEVKSFHLG